MPPAEFRPKPQNTVQQGKVRGFYSVMTAIATPVGNILSFWTSPSEWRISQINRDEKTSIVIARSEATWQSHNALAMLKKTALDSATVTLFTAIKWCW